MYSILLRIAAQQKEQPEKVAIVRFRSGAVYEVQEWIDVRTNSVKIAVNYGEHAAEVHFLPEAVESAMIRYRE